MRLHEYEAADIFESMGIPVPQRGVAETPEDAQRIAGEIGSPVALKAQVLAGGRGLAGGVKFASSPRETRKLSEELFGAEIQGLTVRKILVSRRVDIVNELYTGITVDGYEGKPVVVVSSEGGVSIEEVAKRFTDGWGVPHPHRRQPGANGNRRIAPNVHRPAPYGRRVGFLMNA